MRLSALLDCHSYFSFGRGASSPSRLVERAAELGYSALALVDDNGVYGAVEAQQAGKKHGVKILIGATIQLTGDTNIYPLSLIAMNRGGYEVLCKLLTAVHANEEKVVTLPVLLAHTKDLICVTGGRNGFPTRLLAERKIVHAEQLLSTLKGAFPERLYIGVYYGGYPNDVLRARKVRDFARSQRVPVVSAPEVRYATPDLHPLFDTLVCARLGVTIRDPHRDRPQNDCLAVPDWSELSRLPRPPLPFPEGMENAEAIVEACNLELLAERLTPPAARLPAGVTLEQHLDERLYTALSERYSSDTFMVAKARLESELVTMKALGLSEFFLVAAEITDFCRSRGIVASGRGSAAASVVCYLLGITGTDPVKHNLLFERFLHTGRTSLPDVDIDIGSSRRDEVLAWVEERFGATTEAMVCNKITYRLPLAVQDLGRGLGIPPVLRNTLSKTLGRDYRHLRPHRAREAQSVFDIVLKDAPVKEVLLRLLERLSHGSYSGVGDLYERLAIDRDTLEALARAGAFDSLQERRDALYQIGALVYTQPPAQKPMLSVLPETPPLPKLTAREKVAWDYRLKGLNEWGVHPVDLMRQQLLSLGATPMVRLPHYGHVTTAGVVIAKQRPPTAKGFAFYVIEDGPLRVQVVISPDLWENKRDVLREARVLIVSGLLEKKDKAWTLRAEGLADAQATSQLTKLET